MVKLSRFGIVVAVAVAGCTGTPEEWGGRVFVSDGVLRVENPIVPLAEPGAVEATLLWSSTGPEKGDFWEAPNRIHASDDFVYVVDRRASKIHRVTPNGELESSLGEPGGGPGQYRSIIDAVPTSSGLFVVDRRNARVEILDSTGGIVASARLDQPIIQVVPVAGDAIAVTAVPGGESGWQRIDASGAVESYTFPGFVDPDTVGVPDSRAGAWNGRPVRLRFTSPQIQIYSRAGGELEKVIDLPLPPEEATDEEIEAMVSEITSFLAEDGVSSAVIEDQARRIRSRPRTKYLYRDLQFDAPSGLMAIWEQNPEDFGSGNASLHLLSIDGIYLASLAFDRAWADFDLRHGVLYALSQDPLTHLVTLEAFSISVPDAVMERAAELANPGS